MKRRSESPNTGYASHADVPAEGMNVDLHEVQYDVTLLSAATSALLGSSVLAASHPVKIPKNCTARAICTAIAKSFDEISQLPSHELDSPISVLSQAVADAQNGSSTTQELIVPTASDQTVFPIPPMHLHNVIAFAVKSGVTPSLEACVSLGISLDKKRLEFVINELLPAIVSSRNLGNIHEKMKADIIKAYSVSDRVFRLSWKNVEEDAAEMREHISNVLGVSCDMSTGNNADADEVPRLRAAFERPFEDPAKYLDAMENTIRRYASEYDPATHYFPGASLVQTSGSGKSRAMIKMADKGLFVVYCSFMNASSSGFPRRSKIADKLLDLRPKNIFSLYFAACFDEAMKYKSNYGEFLKQQMDQSTHDSFWANIEQSMDNLAKNSKFLSEPLSHPVFAGNKTLEILFVFDEARAMIPDQIGSVSAFIEMRRSATLFKEQCRAFVIMIDTTSRVSALAPAAAKDSSYRVQIGHQIFTPLFLIGSMDVGLQTLYSSKMEDALTRRVQYKRGRPLWQSLLDGYSSLVVRDTAIRKMNGGFTNSAIPAFELPFAATVIRSRVPFVVHRFELASELVASHMWWCVQISDDRQHLVVTLPSEPVIAEAGACWLNDVGHRIKILKIFVNALSQMYFEVGTNGETVAQLVLIFGRDGVRRALPEESDSSPVGSFPVTDPMSNLKTFTGPIDLKDFLQHTFSAKLVDGLSKALKVLSQQTGLADPYAVGKLSFTHFVGLIGTLSGMEAVALYFSRSAAICCTKGTWGVDLIIPILMPNQAGEYIIHADNMSFILVQVQNYALHSKEHKNLQSATAFNLSHPCKLDSLPQHLYISLCMGLGGDDASVELPNNPQPSYSPSLEEQCLHCPKDFAQYQECQQKMATELAGSKTNKFIEMWQTHRQVSAAILGLSPEVYPCLSKGTKDQVSELLASLKAMCNPPQNPVSNAKDKTTKSILQRIMYAQDPTAFKQHELLLTVATTGTNMDLD